MPRQLFAAATDSRIEPRIPTATIVKMSFLLYWARLESLNVLDGLRKSHFVKKLLEGYGYSGDTIGRVQCLMDSAPLRRTLYHVYTRLKRNKALPLNRGWMVAVLDGHESYAGYQRHCPSCLRREINTAQGTRTQYYHRQVTLMLLPGVLPNGQVVRLLLDFEPQRPGEDEVACALRLLRRVLLKLPRAFDIVLADALYAQAGFFNLLIEHHKHALVVLKDDRRNLYQDFLGLQQSQRPQNGYYRKRCCRWWDFEEFSSWPQVAVPLRVVGSRESWTTRSQCDGLPHSNTSEWIWVTTMPRHMASTSTIVNWGHQRWDIENHGFNEMTNSWCSDHVLRHDPVAIENFLLIAFISFNIYQAFLSRNLRAHYHTPQPLRHWVKLIQAELYASLPDGRHSAPY